MSESKEHQLTYQLLQLSTQAAALAEALEDIMWAIKWSPKCQRGVLARCECKICTTSRAQATLSAFLKFQETNA